MIERDNLSLSLDHMTMHHRHIIPALAASTVILCLPALTRAQPAPAPMEVAIITGPAVPDAIDEAMRSACDRSTKINLHATKDATLATSSIDKPTWSMSEEETRRIGAAMKAQRVEVVLLVGVWEGEQELVVLGPDGAIRGRLDANLDASAATFKADIDALLERAFATTARAVLAHRSAREGAAPADEDPVARAITEPPGDAPTRSDDLTSSTQQDPDAPSGGTPSKAKERADISKASSAPERAAVRMLPQKILFVDVHGTASNTSMEFSGEKQRYATLNTAGVGFHAHGDTPFTAYFKYRWHLGGFIHRGAALAEAGVDNVQEERVTGRRLGVGISAVFPFDIRAQFGPMLGYEFARIEGGPPVPTSTTRMGRLLWTLRVPYKRFSMDAAMGLQVGTAENPLDMFTPTDKTSAFGLEASTNATVLLGERVILRAGARVRRVTIEGAISPSTNFSTFNDRHIHSDLGVGVAL